MNIGKKVYKYNSLHRITANVVLLLLEKYLYIVCSNVKPQNVMIPSINKVSSAVTMEIRWCQMRYETNLNKKGKDIRSSSFSCILRHVSQRSILYNTRNRQKKIVHKYFTLYSICILEHFRLTMGIRLCQMRLEKYKDLDKRGKDKRS